VTRNVEQQLLELLVAPAGKHFRFGHGSGYNPEDLLDGGHAKRPELAG
jgi:hypothetical protein